MRKQVEDRDIELVLDGIKTHLYMVLEKKGYGAFASRHEILGCVTEEYIELVEAVRSGIHLDVNEELRDVAISAIWGLVSNRVGVDW